MHSKTYRPTYCEIDLDAIRHNCKEIRKLSSPQTKIMAIVKANAYGHGIVEVAEALVGEQVDYLGVATVEEALKLRHNNIKIPILILGTLLTDDEIHEAVQNNITITVANEFIIQKIKKITSRTQKPAKIHIDIDTGMGRIGINCKEAVNFIKEHFSDTTLCIEGLFTHFASAARDRFFTLHQLKLFSDIVTELNENGIRIEFLHCTNSVAIVDYKLAHFNMVRSGILFYGISPKKGFEQKMKLWPAMSLKTKIVFLKSVPRGTSISYGRTYITERDTKIATLPIGYADGYGRILSNKAEVLIRGQQAKVVGKVTMDQTMIDVGHINDVKLGDEVVLIGCQGKAQITSEELAKLCGTIPYEIVCSISDRVPRIYKNLH